MKRANRFTLVLDREVDEEIIHEVQALTKQHRAGLIVGQAATAGASALDAFVKAQVIPAERRVSMVVRVRMTQTLERLLSSVDRQFRTYLLTALVRAGWPERNTFRLADWSKKEGPAQPGPDWVEPEPKSAPPVAEDDLKDDWLDRTNRVTADDAQAAGKDEDDDEDVEIVRFGNVEFRRTKAQAKKVEKAQGFSIKGLVGGIDDDTY